jgi:hypothetical protein
MGNLGQYLFELVDNTVVILAFNILYAISLIRNLSSMYLGSRWGTLVLPKLMWAYCFPIYQSPISIMVYMSNILRGSIYKWEHIGELINSHKFHIDVSYINHPMVGNNKHE